MVCGQVHIALFHFPFYSDQRLPWRRFLEIPWTHRVAKTGHKGVDVKIPDNKDKENKPEECILVWRVTSRVILNLQFNESAKLPWISGSVFDPCTTWPSRCLECQNCLRLPDGLERRADQSENLMVLENLLKSCISAGSVPQYNLPCSHTQSTPEKVNTKCLGKV